MKKIVLCIMTLAMLSCSLEDENTPIENTNSIRFNLNNVAYSLTEFNVQLDSTNSMNRIVEASFDDNSKAIRFFVLVEETNQIGEFIFINNDVHYSSDVNFGNRETSITTHTNSKMEGTFNITTDATFDEPVFTFTNGIINIEY
ncbi:hypothetical protein [uncultured Kordia sp.]|uniref:hypothetical protein n=1 Tax=uncultured Kordia sp. TaxID=507699 RepID=UPI00261DB62E|nr:hypothetical protein [uncultured Kordia sp.]